MSSHLTAAQNAAASASAAVIAAVIKFNSQTAAINAGAELRASKDSVYAGKLRQWNENRARAAADHARVMATPEAQLAIQADQARAAAEIASVRPAQELYDALIRQQDAARGPSGTTPVKKLKPAKKAPKKPLKKPKGRR